MEILTRIAVTILFLLSFISFVLAQTAASSRVSGVIKDVNGAVVIGATVKLIDKTKNVERVAVTNSDGLYTFGNVDPGTYDLSVAQSGFRTILFAEIKADVATSSVHDAVLEVGNPNETVTVSATDLPALQTDDATVGNTIEQARINRLPIQNRGQVTSLLTTTQPAVSLTGHVAGSRSDQNTYSLDGLDVSDQVGNRGAVGTVVPIPAESVEEFRVTVTNPNASFGRSGGGQATLVTKRGGNSFNGSAYWYLQNDNLNANTWSRNRLGQIRPESKDNRYGFSFGGPIWKDRTFFFTNLEGHRIPGSQTVSRNVPTESLRNGILRFADASGVVRDYSPQTFDPRGLGANPQILAYLRRFPLPNVAGTNPNVATFTTQIAANTEDDFAVLRLDHRINSKWAIEARGSYFRSINLSPAQQANILDLIAGSRTIQIPKNLNIAVTGNIKSNFTNELRYGRAFDHFSANAIDPSTVAGFNVPVDIAGIDELIDLDVSRGRTSRIGTTQCS